MIIVTCSIFWYKRHLRTHNSDWTISLTNPTVQVTLMLLSKVILFYEFYQINTEFICLAS